MPERLTRAIGGVAATLCLLLLSCTTTRNYNPGRKFTKSELTKDYDLLQTILETKHPSLYWYTSRDSMDIYFKQGRDRILDTMTELTFGWQVLAPLLANIRCGHTSFMMSKGWDGFIKEKTIPSFPLSVKVWNDSMMVVADRDKKNKIPRGAFLQSINGMKVSRIIDTLFRYMSADGYADNLDNLRLSTSFPYFYRNVFGIYKTFEVAYTDSLGGQFVSQLNWDMPERDTTKPLPPPPPRVELTRRQRLARLRSLEIDSVLAVMTVNTFIKGGLNQFFRKSFRKIRKNHIQNLVIDLRINGGGEINKATSLARYIRNTSFRVADTVWSKEKNFNPYSSRIGKSFWYNLGLLVLTKKQADGNYHYGYWERHAFKPRKKNHFEGKVYVLTNGLTFSASSLFCNMVRGEQGVTLTGEETGGGWYGNGGVMIPNITLPNTKLRVRLPFFRLVQANHPEVKGTGVPPDWYIGPDWRDVLTGRDTKLEAIKASVRAEAKSQLP